MELKKRNGNKRLALLFVLRALEQHSDERHPIKQVTLAKLINDIGATIDEDVWCDRKTVGRHIDLLIAAGYDIVKVRGKGCYMRSPKLSESEIKALVAIVKRSDIEEKYKRYLTKKLFAQRWHTDLGGLKKYLGKSSSKGD